MKLSEKVVEGHGCPRAGRESMRVRLETAVHRLAGHLKKGRSSIVPHFADSSTKEADGSNLSYFDELERHGFRKLLHRRKYDRTKVVDRLGVYPADDWIFQQV